jgi:hypothetical protein
VVAFADKILRRDGRMNAAVGVIWNAEKFETAQDIECRKVVGRGPGVF